MTTRPSAAEDVAAQLRDGLFSGRFHPGHRLKEEELVVRFGVGRYTVRSALRILVNSGLLEHRRNRGATVPTLTAERVEAVTDFREVLEVGALRLALDRGADFVRVAEATRTLQDLKGDASWADVVDVHQLIHHELVAASGNKRVLQTYMQCEEELRYVISTVRPDYTARHLAELHSKLMTGLRQGGEQAVNALREDLREGRQAVLDASYGMHRQDNFTERGPSSRAGASCCRDGHGHRRHTLRSEGDA